MARWAPLFVAQLSIVAASACVVTPGDGPSEPSEPEAMAYTSYDEVPDEDLAAPCASRDLEAIAEATDRSVHELVTCGGLQVQLAQSMVGLLLLSNDRMFDEKTREDLAEFGDLLPKNSFEPLADGRWRIQMGAESYFDLEFTDPNDGSRIVEDPFDMETYLIGLRATYEMTFEEMMDAPEEKNRWVFTWDEPGPLVHLLNDGAEVPKEFELSLSLYDIVTLVYPGFLTEGQPDSGPFQSLFDIPMSSEIHLREERSVTAGVAEVRYEVLTKEQPVGVVAATAGLDFELVSLRSKLRQRELRATDATVAYRGGVGALTGVIEMESEDDRVVLDFGDGQSYPERQWTCDNN